MRLAQGGAEDLFLVYRCHRLLHERFRNLTTIVENQHQPEIVLR